MSRVEIQGMLPESSRIMGVLEEEARAALQEAKDVIVREVESDTPRSDRAGPHLADEYTGRVSKTRTGWQMRASYGRRDHRGVSAAQVARWVTRGTGLFREGPGPKNLIRPKFQRVYRHPMNLGNGVERWSVRGQHPNPFIQRARESANERATQVLREGAARAAARMRKGHL